MSTALLEGKRIKLGNLANLQTAEGSETCSNSSNHSNAADAAPTSASTSSSTSSLPSLSAKATTTTAAATATILKKINRIGKTNRGRPVGSKSAHGSQKPGPKTGMAAIKRANAQDTTLKRSRDLFESFLGRSQLSESNPQQDISPMLSSTENNDTSNELENNNNITPVDSGGLQISPALPTHPIFARNNATPQDLTNAAFQLTQCEFVELVRLMGSHKYSMSSNRQSKEAFFDSIKTKYPCKMLRNFVWSQIDAGLTEINPPNPTTNILSEKIKSYYYLKKVHIWIPEWHWRLYNDGKIKCPSCDSSNFTVPHGFVTRRVIDENDCAILLGRRYKCRSCSGQITNINQRNRTLPSDNHAETTTNVDDDDFDKTTGTFNTWNSEVLRNLPAVIRQNFDYLLTHKSGIRYTIVDGIVDDLVSGKSISACQDRLSHNHRRRYFNLYKQYLSAAQHVKKSHPESVVSEFLSFDHPDGYNGFIPSEHYISSVFYKYFELPIFDIDSLTSISDTKLAAEIQSKMTREYYQHRRQQMIDGTIWSMDAAYKVANLIVVRNPSALSAENPSSDGQSTCVFKSIFTVFNQYEQIIFQKALLTDTLDELESELKLVFLNRFRAKGYSMPCLIFTDRCCDERSFLEGLLDKLKNIDPLFEAKISLPSPNTQHPLPPLDFLDESTTQSVEAHNNSRLAVICNLLRENILNKNIKAAGLDIEWTPHCINGGRFSHPGTLQISSGTQTVIFSLYKKNVKQEKLPKPLLDLLYDPDITFVGNNIKGDLTRLQSSYGIETNKIKFKDLSAVAASRGYNVGVSSLASQCRTLLRKNLKKSLSTVMTNWHVYPLTESQQKYAALDALASYLVYEKLMLNSDPRQLPPPSSLEPDTQVLLFSKSRAECIGRGKVVANSSGLYGEKRLKTARKNRIIVQMVESLVPGALAPYPCIGATTCSPLRVLESKEIMWDMDCVREETAASLGWLESLRNAIDDIQVASSNDFSSPSDDDDFFTSVQDHAARYVDGTDEVEDFFLDILESDDSSSDNEFLDDTEDERCQILNDKISSSQDTRIHVRLDIFHALNRLARVLKKSHGAFRAFMSRLRDAFFLICKEDIDLVSDALKNFGLSDDQIKDKKENEWSFFLKYSRRAVPSKEILLKRFDKVIDTFQNVKDAFTGETLFNAKAKKQIESLRKHIENDCLSDVPSIPLYFDCGRTSNGFPKYRCCRGTNSNEGYHRHMRKILHKHTGSPRLAHHLLMEFNFRWNIRMAIKNRGMSEACGGFYNQSAIDEINMLAADGLLARAPFECWKGVLEYEDTLERTCLRVSGDDTTFLPLDSPQQTLEATTTEPVVFNNLTKSAKQFEKLMKSEIPVMPVSTRAERRKFKQELQALVAVSGEINWDLWAEKWNISVIEAPISGKNGKIRLKTASHLKAFYSEYEKISNSAATMKDIRTKNIELKSQLQSCQSASTNLFDVAQADPPILIPNHLESLTPPSAAVLQQSPAEITVVQQSPAEITGSHTAPNPMQINRPKIVIPLLPLNQNRQSNLSMQANPAKKIIQRGTNGTCQKCGHEKGAWRDVHQGRGGACKVSETERRAFILPCVVSGCSKSQIHFHTCDCSRCKVE